MSKKEEIRESITVEEKFGVKIERQPSKARLKELDIRTWPKWGCPPGKFSLIYDAEETFYMVRGRVKAYVSGHGEDGCVEFNSGDLVVIPKGMRCTWHVSAHVDKHYTFSSSSC